MIQTGNGRTARKTPNEILTKPSANISEPRIRWPIRHEPSPAHIS